MTAQTLFQTIATQLMADHDGVEMGRMMSSPAITYRGKVLAFFHNGMMTFKLGEAFAPESLGIEDYELLAPFKTKPPMRAWFSVSFTERDHWPALAVRALSHMQAELSG